MAHYIALIRKEADSDYGVEFPDFPGCISAGSTLDEARANAAEALALHLAGMAEDGEEAPEPASLDAVMLAPEAREAVAFLVEAAMPDKVERVNITVPSGTLRQIDAHARRVGLSRSAFLVRAAKREIDAA